MPQTVRDFVVQLHKLLRLAPADTTVTSSPFNGRGLAELQVEDLRRMFRSDWSPDLVLNIRRGFGLEASLRIALKNDESNIKQAFVHTECNVGTTGAAGVVEIQAKVAMLQECANLMATIETSLSGPIALDQQQKDRAADLLAFAKKETRNLGTKDLDALEDGRHLIAPNGERYVKVSGSWLKFYAHDDKKLTASEVLSSEPEPLRIVAKVEE